MVTQRPAHRVLLVLATIEALLGVGLAAASLTGLDAGAGHIGVGIALILIGLVGPIRISLRRLLLPAEVSRAIHVHALGLPTIGALLVALGLLSAELPTMVLASLAGGLCILTAYAGFFSLSRRLPENFTISEMLSIMRSAGIAGSKQDSPANREFMRWSQGRRAGVSAGQPAPGGEVVTLDGEHKDLRAWLEPDSLIVLNFGSYSCPHHRKRLPELEAVAARWRPRGVRFLTIYTAEAHPDDGWKLAGQYIDDAEYTREEDFCFRYAVTIEDREAMARRLVEAKQLDMEVILDGMGDELLTHYNSWPIRLYIVRAGQVLYCGEQGPFGYVPLALDAALRDQI